MNLKPFASRYGGIIVGALYALIMRLLFNAPDNVQFNDGRSIPDLFSVSFIWVLPFIIGITPLLFATTDQLAFGAYRVVTPMLTVMMFFTVCFITRIEDIICILIIAGPFLLAALIGGYFFSKLILYYRRKKGILYSVFFVPLLASIIEAQFKTPVQTFEVKTTTVINAPVDSIWKNIVRVHEIDNKDYNKGFFNYAGIPRPLYAELDRDAIGATRIGHFEGGLQFKETVTHWDRNRKVAFNIKIVPSSIHNTVFEQHILKGRHFEFLDAAYELKQLSPGKTQLSLTSSYKLDTNINFYASTWGNVMLGDFQQRLLDVIKKRCDQ